MRKLNIDPEFKNLISPLSDEEYNQLKENLIEEGCRDSLVAWNETILDGHNRYEICMEKKIPFSVDEMDFESRDEALEWMIKNQFGRRNLPSVVRVKLALRLKEVIQEKARKNMESGINQHSPLQLVGKASPIHTDKELGKLAGVSSETIRRYEKIQKEAEPEVKEKVDKGEMSIRKGFNTTLPKKTVTPPSIKKELTPELETATRKCSICGRDKLPSEYYSERMTDCKKCHSERKRSGLTASEARELNEFVSDEVIEGYYQEMKNPPPKTVGSESSSNNDLNPIIAELDETLKAIKAQLNRFTFMGDSFPSDKTLELLSDIHNDLNKINSKIKE